jgi:hemoglobin/transferrin/lactoferrin receptor protein
MSTLKSKKTTVAVQQAMLVAVLATQALASISLAQAAAGSSIQLRQSYKIAAGRLDQVLQQFVVQAKIELSYDPLQIQALRSAGLQGEYTVEQALQALLAEHQLSAQKLNNGYVLISQKTSKRQQAATVPTAKAVPVASAVAGQTPYIQLHPLYVATEDVDLSQHRLTAAYLQATGANDFGRVVRYETLVSAPGSHVGSSAGKSSFDRGGYSGYNIRGLQGNRLNIDIDDIPQPVAAGRAYAYQNGPGTTSIGRDYLDPYNYSAVDIVSGATGVDKANHSMAGSVSYQAKTAEQFLQAGQQQAQNYQFDYDSSNQAYHHGLTAAAKGAAVDGLIAYSRRDGKQSQNNSSYLEAYPADWNSNAVMLSSNWRINPQHKLTLVADYYDRWINSRYETYANWYGFNQAEQGPVGLSQQDSESTRYGLSVQYQWQPDRRWIDQLNSKVYYQSTKAQDVTVGPNEVQEQRVIQKTHSGFDTEIWGLLLSAEKTWGNHQLSAGLNGYISHTERNLQQDTLYTDILWSGIPADDPDDLNLYSKLHMVQPQVDSQSYQIGAFVQDKWRFQIQDHQAYLIPGLRYIKQSIRAVHFDKIYNSATNNHFKQKAAEIDQKLPGQYNPWREGVITFDDINRMYGGDNRDAFLLPQLIAGIELNPELQVYAQYRAGVRFATPDELYSSWNVLGSGSYSVIGNTQLKPEESDNWQLGIKGKLGQGISFNGSIFYNKYQNFISYVRYENWGCYDDGSCGLSNRPIQYKPENRDEAWMKGIDLTSKFDLGVWWHAAQGYQVSLAWGYMKGQQRSAYDSLGWEDIDTVPPMKAVLGLSYDASNRRFGAALHVTAVKGKQAVNGLRNALGPGSAASEDNTVAEKFLNTDYMRVPGYVLLDVAGYFNLTPNIKLNAGLYNLTNRQYWDYSSAKNIFADGSSQYLSNRALGTMPGRYAQIALSIDF